MSHIRFLRPRLAAALVLVCAASTSVAALTPSPVKTPKPALSTPAKHMLFRIRGTTGATVYLLGSVHLLSPEAGKLPWEVDSAFARAKTIAFETSLDSVQLRAQEMMVRARYSNGASLRSTLTPAGAAKADTVLKGYGLSVDQLNQFKPWFVSLIMGQLVMQKAKFAAEYGVDMQLNARAKQAGKPVIGLESVDFQMGLFDSISPADQEKMLISGNEPDSTMHQLMVIKDAWLEGNATKLDSLLNSRMADAPGLFATLISSRNKTWIPAIEQMLKGKDDVLVVVGAAHLVGKEGVLEMLKKKGYAIEQM